MAIAKNALSSLFQVLVHVSLKVMETNLFGIDKLVYIDIDSKQSKEWRLM